MASVAKRPDGKWRARYRDPDGKEHSKHFARKIDAERYTVKVAADVLRGQYLDPAAGKVTFGDYAEKWRHGQIHRGTTAARVEVALRRHVLPSFGAMPLASVTRSQVQSWVKGRSQLLAPSTVALTYGYLATIYKAAVSDGLLARTPCTGIRLPEVTRVQVVAHEQDVPGGLVAPTPAQVLDLAAVVPDRYRALVLLSAGAGLRVGEALGLTVDRLDFLRRRVVVDRQALRSGGFGPPKTPASVRVVPLGDDLLGELAEHLRRWPTARDGDSAGLVFTTVQGRPIRSQHLRSHVWLPALRAAGLPLDTHWHSFRHSYASTLIAAGEPVKVIQSRLGHASITEAMDTYGHLFPESEGATRQAVDSAYAAARAARADSLRTADHPHHL